MSAKLFLQLIMRGLVDASVDIGTVSHDIQFQPSFNFDDGTGANQVKNAFLDTRTLAASATENLDLSGGLTNALGQSLVFTKIRALVVRASPANVNDVVVGGAASNAWLGPFGGTLPTLAIGPAGLLVLVAPDAAGWPVVAATGDILKVANSAAGSSVSYDVVIFGTT